MRRACYLLFAVILAFLVSACAGPRVKSEIGSVGLDLATEKMGLAVLPSDDITYHENGVIDAKAKIYLVPRKDLFTIDIGAADVTPSGKQTATTGAGATSDNKNDIFTLGTGILTLGTGILTLGNGIFTIGMGVVDAGARIMFIPTDGRSVRRTEVFGKDSLLVVAPGEGGLASMNTALVGSDAVVLRLTKGDSGYGLWKQPRAGEIAKAKVHFLPTGEGAESEGTGIILVVPKEVPGGGHGVFVIVPGEDFTGKVAKRLE